MEKNSGHDQQMDMTKGESIVGENTLWWTLAGLLIGAAAGWLIGIPFGYGRLNIAGLAPLATGGIGVAIFIFDSFFGSLLGLTGALLGTSTEARKDQKDHSRSKHEGMKHGKPSLIESLPIYGSVALVLFMAFTLSVIGYRAVRRGESSDQSNRVTWNQKNLSRVGGATDAETATYVLQSAYPATRAENRPGTIVRVADDWRVALAATALISRPTNAALFVYSAGGADTEAAREIERLSWLGAAAPSPSPLPSTSAFVSEDAMPSVPVVGLGLKNAQWTALVILAVSAPMLIIKLVGMRHVGDVRSLEEIGQDR